MQPEADLGDTVAFQPKIDAAAEAALRPALPLDRPAEPFTAGPAGGGQSQELLGIAKLIAAVGRRHSRPPDHLGITALLHHRGKIAAALAARSVTPAFASIKIGTASGKLRAVGSVPGGAFGRRARLGGGSGFASAMGFIQPLPTRRAHNRGSLHRPCPNAACSLGLLR